LVCQKKGGYLESIGTRGGMNIGHHTFHSGLDPMWAQSFHPVSKPYFLGSRKIKGRVPKFQAVTAGGHADRRKLSGQGHDFVGGPPINSRLLQNHRG